MSTISGDIYNSKSITNPYHKHEQAPRLGGPVTECADCGTLRAITGDLPVDLYHVADGTEAGMTMHLCLGDLASRRALGQDVSRVEAVE